jgi:plasmid stabilization system protein ParE
VKLYTLNFSKLFYDDVKSSVSYIKEILKAPIAAKRLKDEVKKAYKSIRKTPFIYPIVKDEDLASMGYRFALVKNFMLFYIAEKEEKTINIIRFLYGRRDWLNILKETDTIDESYDY